MPTLYIHSGRHKTGTTSLQKTLFDHSRTLARHGYLYPRTGLSQIRNNWGHHDLAYALRQRSTGTKLWTELRTEADTADLPNVVVSSEELSLLPFSHFPGTAPYRMITEVFEGYDIRLICYLRPQADMAASLYNHNVKAAGETADIMQFLVRVAKRLDYAYYLNVAATALGPEAIVVRRYLKQYMQGDTISDFAAQIGLDAGVLPTPPKGLNMGLTDAGLEAMLAANRRLANHPELLKVERLRIIHHNRAESFQGANPLSPDARRTITALHAQSNRLIARRYLGLDEDLFGPLDLD